VQIKPQLEKLLQLPNDSLTKEIRLTQDLLRLFIEYQIPSDLISYAGTPDASKEVKVDTVRKYVAAMYEMIADSKKKEIEIEEQKQDYRLAQRDEIVVCYDEKKSIKKKSSGARFKSKSSARECRMEMACVSESAPPQPCEAPADVNEAPAAEEPKEKQFGGDQGEEEVQGIDFTKIPTELDKKYGELDEDSALRPTIINVGVWWEKRSQRALLAEPTTESMGVEEQKREKNKAFDLLDALTKSGGLAVTRRRCTWSLPPLTASPRT
jgi:hypothetical protein